MKLGAPADEEETVELLQLIVADGKGFSIDLTMMTATDHNPATGEWTVTTYDGLTFLLVALTPGDADGNGYVDAADVSILAQHWLQASVATWAEGDFNRDGAVDDVDATILAANWNPQSSNVPEPCTLVLLAGTLLLGLLRRKRNKGGAGYLNWKPTNKAACPSLLLSKIRTCDYSVQYCSRLKSILPINTL